MRSKAIFFTVYNRIEYLKPTLEQWLDVEDIVEYDIYFRVEPSSVMDEVLKEIKDFRNKVNAHTHVIVNDEKQGCARNTWNGFNELFERYDFLILTEDDIFPAADVCKYFTFLENKYRDDEEVAVISANYEMDDNSDIHVSRVPIFRGQIWGTWKNMWEKYIRDTWDFAYDSSEDGGPAGWDWNLTLRVLPRNNIKTLVPHSARSQHMGVIGLHCNEHMFHKTQMSSFKKNRYWEELIEV